MAISKVVSHRFTNERGSEVYIRASEEPIQGVAGVLLYVTGPDTDTEMHVTRQEGLELLTLLSKLLKNARR
jgi:hypothetical protein